MFKGLIAAAASIGLMATPAMAASTAAAQAIPTSETVSGMAQADDAGGPNWAIILGVVVAVGLGLWAALDSGNGNDHPTSP